MTDKTKHRQYTLPAAGDSNWHEPVNENWERIDADIQAVIEAAEAALEAANGDAGDPQ